MFLVVHLMNWKEINNYIYILSLPRIRNFDNLIFEKKYWSSYLSWYLCSMEGNRWNKFSGYSPNGWTMELIEWSEKPLRSFATVIFGWESATYRTNVTLNNWNINMRLTAYRGCWVCQRGRYLIGMNDKTKEWTNERTNKRPKELYRL